MTEDTEAPKLSAGDARWCARRLRTTSSRGGEPRMLRASFRAAEVSSRPTSAARNNARNMRDPNRALEWATGGMANTENAGYGEQG